MKKQEEIKPEVILTDEEIRMKVMVDKAKENELLAQQGNRFGQSNENK